MQILNPRRRPPPPQVDLCKAMKAFPKAMSGCVRELFARMGVLDTELRGRLAEWLAFQLSNFEFVWPWHKWLHVAKAPPHDAQRCGPSSILFYTKAPQVARV